MKSGCHHHQIGMNHLCDAIFKMAATEIGKIMFLSYNSASRVDRIDISVSTPIFLRFEELNESTETGFYDFHLTHDELPVTPFSKWPPRKLAKSCFLPITQLLGLRQEWDFSVYTHVLEGEELNKTIYKLLWLLFDSWWATCVMSCSKLLPRKLTKSRLLPITPLLG